jgi:hypothetical protein
MVGTSTRSTAADAPSVRSTVTSVVVHASGAVVTRRARLDLPAYDGAVTVRVAGLPVTLYEHSLRGCVVSGPAGLRVTDVRLDFAAVPRRGDEVPGLRLDLEDAQDRRSRLRDRRDRLSGEIAEVAGFRAEPPPQRRGDPARWAPVESILTLAGFVDSRLALLHERLRTTEDELAAAEHDVDVIGHRLDATSTVPRTERTERHVSAILALAPDGPRDDAATTARPVVEVVVEVEYQVPGATWAPVYRLRVDRSSGAGTLALRACVAQRTGEDWTGVHLGLSTADLLRRTDLPELRSLRIGRTQEEPGTPNWREPPAGLEELFAGYDAAAASRTPQPPVVEPAASSVPGYTSPPPSLYPFPPAAAPPDGVGHNGAQDHAGHGGYGGTFGAPAPGDAPRRMPGVEAAQPRQAAGSVLRSRHAVRPSAPAESAADGRSAGPAPSADMLDYTRLTMTGPDAPEGRGTLRPGPTATDAVVAEHRRRADTVARPAPPAHVVEVRASAGSFDYRFDTAAPVEVGADGLWHTVPVSEVPVRTEFEYVCVPSVDESVFGTVLVTNTSSHALLAGPVDVMIDGDFVLTAALPTLAPGQRQAVGVGVAESVQVARRTHLRESTARLRGGTTVLDHTVEVELANRLPHPVVVEVRERVPVTSDKDVRIEEHRAQPPWSEPGRPLDGQEGSYVRGARIWRVALDPGRTTTLTGGFEIRLPAGKAVVGGNRRD